MSPPFPRPIITNPSSLTRAEMDALLRIGKILGPVSLDVKGGIAGGDYLP